MDKNARLAGRICWLLVVIGFAIRLIFVFKVSAFLHGVDNAYTNGDSYSYVLSITNFLKYGKYSFDLTNPSATFGRLPGYPIFWGLIYLLTGGHGTYIGVAIMQSVIDSLCIHALFKVIIKAKLGMRTALIAAIIYATYFFTIVWVPITGSEILACDITILICYQLAGFSVHKKAGYFFLLGLLIAICFYVRDFLGIMLVIVNAGLIIRWLQKKISLLPIIMVTIGFLSLYVLWPLRNMINYHKVELVKPVTAGYRNFTDDYNQFKYWVYSWNTDVQPYQEQILRTDKPVTFPAYVYDGTTRQHVDSVIDMARHWSSGFYYWDYYNGLAYKPWMDSINKNNEVAAGFKQLHTLFVKQHPIITYVAVPAQNLQKAFFKSGLNNKSDNVGKKQWLSKILFGYRTLLLILGIIGLFYMPLLLLRFCIAFLFGFIYLFICFFIRQVEMRYLLQADVVMLIPAAYVIDLCIKSFSGRKPHLKSHYPVTDGT